MRAKITRYRAYLIPLPAPMRINEPKMMAAKGQICTVCGMRLNCCNNHIRPVKTKKIPLANPTIDKTRNAVARLSDVMSTVVS